MWETANASGTAVKRENQQGRNALLHVNLSSDSGLAIFKAVTRYCGLPHSLKLRRAFKARQSQPLFRPILMLMFHGQC